MIITIIIPSSPFTFIHTLPRVVPNSERALVVGKTLLSPVLRKCRLSREDGLTDQAASLLSARDHQSGSSRGTLASTYLVPSGERVTVSSLAW